MTFRALILYFGIPMLAVAANVHFVMPWIAARGMSVFWNYLLVYATAPMLLLIGPVPVHESWRCCFFPEVGSLDCLESRG